MLTYSAAEIRNYSKLVKMEKTDFVKKVNWEFFKSENSIKSDYIIDKIIDVLNIENTNNYPLILFPKSFKDKLNRDFICGKRYSHSRDGVYMEDLLADTFYYCGEFHILAMEEEKKKMYSYNNMPYVPSEPKREIAPSTYTKYVRTRKGCGCVFSLWSFFTVLILLVGWNFDPGMDINDKIQCNILLFILCVPLLFLLICDTEWSTKNKECKYSSKEIKSMQKELDEKYKKNMMSYRMLRDRYPKAMEKYQKIKKFQISIIEERGYNIVSNIITSNPIESTAFIQIDNGPQKGASEDLLFYHLMKCIDKNIAIDGKVGRYFPDIIIKLKNGINIDIEIDEPYEYISKKETHYIGCGDEKRNKYFLDNNWFVIRFSESQIKNKFYDCIKIIIQIKKMLESGYHRGICISKIANDISEPRWTKEEARMMAIKSSRTI